MEITSNDNNDPIHGSLAWHEERDLESDVHASASDVNDALVKPDVEIND